MGYLMTQKKHIPNFCKYYPDLRFFVKFNNVPGTINQVF